jgi:hypothetical protein
MTNRNWNRRLFSNHDAETGIEVSSAVRDRGMGAVSECQQKNNVTASPRETILPFSEREVSGFKPAHLREIKVRAKRLAWGLPLQSSSWGRMSPQ